MITKAVPYLELPTLHFVGGSRCRPPRGVLHRLICFWPLLRPRTSALTQIALSHRSILINRTRLCPLLPFRSRLVPSFSRLISPTSHSQTHPRPLLPHSVPHTRPLPPPKGELSRPEKGLQDQGEQKERDRQPVRQDVQGAQPKPRVGTEGEPTLLCLRARQIAACSDLPVSSLHYSVPSRIKKVAVSSELWEGIITRAVSRSGGRHEGFHWKWG